MVKIRSILTTYFSGEFNYALFIKIYMDRNAVSIEFISLSRVRVSAAAALSVV